MRIPSLHVHYKHFITTTAKSAPCSSTTSCVVCFLLQFNRTLQGSPVPYHCLNTCLANSTPDAAYPVIRLSGTLCRSYPRNYLLLTSSFAFTRLRHWFTCVQLTVFAPAEIVLSAFPYRSPPIPLEIRSIRRFGNCS
jgi:hypothetical protein